jgi:hypothetical protein
MNRRPPTADHRAPGSAQPTLADPPPVEPRTRRAGTGLLAALLLVIAVLIVIALL